ncbi:MAG: fumarylacetoacetate hydrolase family protein [Pseudomonadota bacterium]
MKIKRVLLVVAIFALAVWLSWITSEDPTHNQASFEEAPLTRFIASRDKAMTLAQFTNESKQTRTILVEGFDGDAVTGIDLRSVGASDSENPFTVLRSLQSSSVDLSETGSLPKVRVSIDDLLSAAPEGSRHIGIGTNFPEHAQEARSDSVFNFPKFGLATPPRTTISAPKDGLLDYEVELCLRFDRPIRTLQDFDEAVKGFFICADFTDRIQLLQLADPDNLDSGYGFSDSKSGPGFFPAGPFLVIPKDWQQFIAETRMTTSLNGEPRQDARGIEMILDFRELTEKVLGDMEAERFFYKEEFYTLAPGKFIGEDMTLMSGTSEGVIFTTPARHDYIEILWRAIKSGAVFRWLTDRSPLMDFAIAEFIENERAGGHFLKPGDVVVYAGGGLGDIEVKVTQ